MIESRYMKRLYKPREFSRLLGDLMSSAGATRGLKKDERISKPFQERIMMAVTEVNGCRYCSYFHTRVALSAGMDRAEIRRVLEGDFRDAPQEELAALYFAQYYAESGGAPDEEALRCLREQYGERRSAAILAYIRAIMIGNAWGNMLDSLRRRLTGNGCKEVSLGDELGVIFGPVVMIPYILVKKFFTGKADIHSKTARVKS